MRKLADGNCWMTENLRLVFTAGDVLTPADTNVSTNTTVTLATQPANQPSTDYYKWGYPANLTDEQIIAYGTVNTWLSRESGKKESQTSSGNLTGEDQDFGVYYNGYTTYAGTTVYDSAPSIDYNYNICPKGWTLPRYSGSDSWFNLIVTTYKVITIEEDGNNTISQDAYNVAAPKLHSFPLSLPISGYASDQTGASHYNNRAYWRTRRFAGNIGQGGLVFRIYPYGPDISTRRGSRYNLGSTIRCVNK